MLSNLFILLDIQVLSTLMKYKNDLITVKSHTGCYPSPSILFFVNSNLSECCETSNRLSFLQ